MTIGERIKELRRKNDLTQEKLADFLGVSYQAVSKWETGLNSPDLSLIGPLTKLLHVSADELLGLNEEVVDARREEFDKEWKDFWLKDDKEANYRIAVQATTEYPGDYKYLAWLAATEYYMAFDEEYRSGGSLDHFNEMLGKSLKHYKLVFENCTDPKLRDKALYGIILDLKFLERLDEGRKYAELYPERKSITRDEALEMCLEGEELLAHRQKMINDALFNLCSKLSNLWSFENINDPCTQAAMDAEEAVIRAVIDDGNIGKCNLSLYLISIKRAYMKMYAGNYEEAVNQLALAKKYAAKYDSLCREKQQYSCILLDHYAQDWNAETWNEYLMCEWKEKVNSPVFSPLYDREDFKVLLNK